MDEFIKVWKTGDVAAFDCKPVLAWVRANQWYAPISACVFYVVAIFVIIPAIRPKNCPKFISKHMFAAWNLFLSVFSWFGVFAAVPYVIGELRTKGFQHMVCSDAMMLGRPEDNPSSLGYIGLMMSLFMLSKFPELLDTFFLAYMNKSIMFLHWYHHITVLLYAWFAFEAAIPTSVFFATINYCVHAIMYFYFGASIYTKKLGFLRKPITSLQLAQMAFGVSLTFIAYLYTSGILGDGNCSDSYRQSHFFISCTGLYGSYFVLFLKLYIDSYVKKTDRRSKKVE
jgi:elongation of very long chain fatty acids protein 6